MTNQEPAILLKLVTTGQTVADPAEDIRGRTVKDKDGREIGKVRNLLVDDREHKVRMLQVEHGGILGIGATASFVPVDAIDRIADDTVYLGESTERVAAAPPYDPELEDQRDYYSNLYGYYGFAPYWGPGLL